MKQTNLLNKTPSLILLQKIKHHVKHLSFLSIASPHAFNIVKTNVSDKEYIIHFHSGGQNPMQEKYSTIIKENLSIIFYFSKFQDDLLNQIFFYQSDCAAAKDIILKDVQNHPSKHPFVRWQGILSIFNFNIEYIKDNLNFIPEFLNFYRKIHNLFF